MDSQTIRILIAMIIYMAIVIVIGVIFAKSANKNSENYFLGGRSLGPWVTAMSAEASDMSGCYSTICIAGPVWVSWQKHKEKKIRKKIIKKVNERGAL